MNDSTQNAAHSNQDALERWKLKRAKLDEIEISRVLEALGADGNQDGDRNKWKYNGYNIIIKKTSTWYNGNVGTGGHGAVDLVVHLMEWDDEEKKDTKAMNWLATQFPEELEGEWVVAAKDDEDEGPKGFRPPERKDDTLDDVRQYLINKRGIPPSLVEREIENGSVYGTKKWNREQREWEESQCVFIGPSSAEVRSTLPDGLKGCSPGSNTLSSGYQVMFRGTCEPIIAQTEAAVDALSYHALNPGVFTISTNGAGRFELQYKLTLEAYRNDFGAQWAYDADGAGDIAAQRQFNALYLRDMLSEKYDVPVERIDEWILGNKIQFVPSDSPHELFLNDLESTSHPVATLMKGKKGEPPFMQLTMERKPATIVFKVQKVCEPLDKGRFEIELSPQDIKNVLKKYKAERVRPQGAKDWNEVWKRQGHRAVNNYEAQFAEKVEKKSVEKHENPTTPTAAPAAVENTVDSPVNTAVENGLPSPVARPNRFARTPVRNK